MQELQKPTYAQVSISLRTDQIEATRRIAIEERHGNFSRLFQELIDAEIERRGMATADARELVAAAAA